MTDDDHSNQEVLNSETVKQHQKRNLVFAVVIVIVFVLIGFFLAGNESKKSMQGLSIRQSLITPIALSGNNIDNGTIWLHRSENNLNQAKQDIVSIKEQLNKINQEKMSEGVTQKTVDDKMMSFEQKLDDLQNQISSQKSSQPVMPQQLNQSIEPSQTFPATIPPAPTLKNDEILLSKPSYKHKSDKNPGSYVPAGTFAKAVLLSGLDASAGVTSQAQPRPVILRIIDNGTLPNDHHGHLKNCFVTGAGFGDISSERVYIRLERMSCVHQDNEILDIPVYGYVSGPDGKAGVRGTAVWRENALLQRSFVSGLLSGVGQGVSNTFTNTSLTPLGAQNTIDSSNILKVGAANGASTALNKLADYNIRRAEQYQPIIQVSSTKVNIVFHTGFYLSENKNADSEHNPIASS